MPVRYKSLALFLPLVLLAGCGDGDGSGWTTTPYHGVPYTMERTAGSGVEYVRANMLKEHGPVIESVTETTKMMNPALAVPPPAPVLPKPEPKAEEMFNKSQRK